MLELLYSVKCSECLIELRLLSIARELLAVKLTTGLAMSIDSHDPLDERVAISKPWRHLHIITSQSAIDPIPAADTPRRPSTLPCSPPLGRMLHLR